MQVIVQELVSKVHAVDAGSVLAPETLARIVAAVLEAIRAEADHRQRVAAEHALENYQEFSQRWRR